MNRTITVNNMDGDPVEVPAKWVLCPDCGGEGTLPPGYVLSEEQTSDPEFMEDYMAGKYDRQCHICRGASKLLVPDRVFLSESLLEAMEIEAEAERENAAEIESERRYLYGPEY